MAVTSTARWSGPRSEHAGVGQGAEQDPRLADEQGTRPDLRRDAAFSSMPPLAAGVESLGPSAPRQHAGGATAEGLARRRGPETPMPPPGLLDEEAPTELQTEPPGFDLSRRRPPSDAADSRAGSGWCRELVQPRAIARFALARRTLARRRSASPSRSRTPGRRTRPFPPSTPISGSGARARAPPARRARRTGSSRSTSRRCTTVRDHQASVRREHENLTLERFEAKLQQNRQSLLERYKCKSVKFQVYIKDGKAAIKATPVKE